MSTKKGTIGVKTADIFPIIKKWLYSEHDIFVRELISNACDAITKRHTLSRSSNFEAPTGSIKVEVDKKNKTITFSDNGLGMTEVEVEKYLAQLAFSGAAEFVEKMKLEGNNQSKDEIIGKFGLGFYSAFMAADKVEVETLSMNEGATAVKWTCAGETEYEFSTSEKKEVGTTIKLFVNSDGEEFLESWKMRQVLRHYCDFMPHPITLVDLNQEKPDEKPDVINDATPLWKKDPTTLVDEDYKNFYKKMFPMDGEPLFWLHLNVDHPFTLQGILFFPKLNRDKPVQEQGLKLYSKQVFVSDNVKSIIPDFLALLKGAIDSTDIPLNVSRSALQGDPNIKKIANYIVKKVGESLKKLFNNDRARYETVWEDIGLFVKYGCVSDTKFDEMMRSMVLFKNTDGKLVTLSDYQTLIPTLYQEKLKDKYITFEKNISDETLRSQLHKENIPVIEIDQMIDPHFTQHTEMMKVGEQNFQFVAIDTEIENLLGETTSDADLKVKDLFTESIKETEFEVKAMKSSSTAAYFKVDQQMKRFQQMTRSMGQKFDMPSKRTLVINPHHPLIKNAMTLWNDGKNKELAHKICYYVQDLAQISSEGLNAEAKEAFVTRSQNLIQELTGLAIH